MRWELKLAVDFLWTQEAPQLPYKVVFQPVSQIIHWIHEAHNYQ